MKITKQGIFGFILGAIIFGSIGVCATTLLSSSSISYSNTTSGITSTNVQSAIDELYDSILQNNVITQKLLIDAPVTSSKQLVKGSLYLVVLANQYSNRGAAGNTNPYYNSGLDVITDSGNQSWSIGFTWDEYRTNSTTGVVRVIIGTANSTTLNAGATKEIIYKLN